MFDIEPEMAFVCIYIYVHYRLLIIYDTPQYKDNITALVIFNIQLVHKQNLPLLIPARLFICWYMHIYTNNQRSCFDSLISTAEGMMHAMEWKIWEMEQKLNVIILMDGTGTMECCTTPIKNLEWNIFPSEKSQAINVPRLASKLAFTL